MKLKIACFVICLIVSELSIGQMIDKPLVIGKTVTFPSKILHETRNINICLPEGYDQNDTLKYPVIYILDGGIEEDFIHIAGIVRYNTQPWINQLPKSIVIGIENTNRRRDFTFSVPNLDFLEKEGIKKEHFPFYGASEKYISFLEEELQPYIENTYKTNKCRTIVGESLAGLLATEILLKHPNMFDTYVIISPSLWWGNETLLHNARKLLNSNLRKPLNIYVGAPNKEEDIRMFNEAETLYKLLNENKNNRVFFDYLPDELHSTVIHQAVYNAFRKLYPKTAYLK